MPGQVGGQVDSLIDIVSFGICPAIILLELWQLQSIVIPRCFYYCCCLRLRLSYFNFNGLDGKVTYQGLASDNNAIIFVFLLESFISTKIESVKAIDL